MNTQEQIAAGPLAWRERSLGAVEVWTEFIHEKAAGIRPGGQPTVFALPAQDVEALDALLQRVRMIVASARVEHRYRETVPQLCTDVAPVHLPDLTGAGARPASEKPTAPHAAPKERVAKGARGLRSLVVLQQWWGADSVVSHRVV